VAKPRRFPRSVRPPRLQCRLLFGEQPQRACEGVVRLPDPQPLVMFAKEWPAVRRRIGIILGADGANRSRNARCLGFEREKRTNPCNSAGFRSVALRAGLFEHTATGRPPKRLRSRRPASRRPPPAGPSCAPQYPPPTQTACFGIRPIDATKSRSARCILGCSPRKK